MPEPVEPANELREAEALLQQLADAARLMPDFSVKPPIPIPLPAGDPTQEQLRPQAEQAAIGRWSSKFPLLHF